jgi:hypothetical protein
LIDELVEKLPGCVALLLYPVVTRRELGFFFRRFDAAWDGAGLGGDALLEFKVPGRPV